MESTGTQSTRVLRERAEDIDLIRLVQGAREEAFATLPLRPGEPPSAALQRLADWLRREPRWRILRQDIFGVLATDAHARQVRSWRMDGSQWPVMWVEQGNGEGAPLAGVQVHALAGEGELAPVRHAGRQVGVTYEDEWARYCVLGGLLPPHRDVARKVQAAETMDLMETLLGQVGMSFTNVFRTWFYLDDILDWYDEFNDARNRFFKQHGIYDRLVPASTGIGGNNTAGAALVANLMAVVPKSDAFQLTALPSPLQCPALEYGSSFSRAVEIRVPGQQRVLVSGTASIEPGGATTHVGDVEAQVATTMEVIEAILKSRGLGWEDSVRAIAYFKHTEDQGAFERYCRSRDLPPLPVLITKNDICRDDLLFELEVDALRAE
jgi:enamine deaminase RidA (YjgF/YER057c/UK114 family)